jgi:N-dimethylarginine dimethylaminohydrolase
MVFPANAAVVLGGRALLAKFRHPERAMEEAPFAAMFETLRRSGIVREVEANPGVVQEGAGDCIWDPSRSLFWAGSGPRSSPASASMIADHFGEEVVELPLATAQYYHLDTCFCPLSGGEILYYPPAIDPAGLRRLRDRVPGQLLIEASDEDAARFCVNAVGLGRSLVMAAPSSALERQLTERGYRVVGVDLFPFLLSGGGAFCMTLRLDLAPPGVENVDLSALATLQLEEVMS